MIYTPDAYLESLEPAPGYYYDEDRADRVLQWYEKNLCFTSADWMGKPFKFLEWQTKVLRPLYGFVDDEGLRQFRVVFIFVPKKNGKTELTSGMSLFHLIADKELAPEVYVVASNLDQAKLCWNGSRHMVEANAVMRRAGLDSRTNPLRILSPRNKGIFRALSSTNRGKQGLRPSAIICDEMHEWRGRDIYDALTSRKATITRSQPLTIIITTAGEHENLCNEIFAKALAIQKGEREDFRFLPAVWCTDNVDDDWRNLDVARQVNPAWNEIIKEDVVREDLQDAKTNELDESLYKMWTLNIFLKKNSRRWLSMTDWDDNTLYRSIPTDVVKLNRMTDLFEDDSIPKYAGLDFAPLRDLSSITLVCRDPITQEVFMKQFSWCTQIESDRKTKAEAIPFNKWGDLGWLTILPDKVIEPSQIGEYLIMTVLLYKVHVVAYDRYRIGKTMDKLVDTGKLKMPVIDIPNTCRSLNEASVTLADLITTNKLFHEDDPLMRYAADNVTCKVDHSALIKPDKSSTVLKIDPIVAGIYAIDCMIREEAVNSGNVKPFTAPRGSAPTQTHDIISELGAS